MCQFNTIYRMGVFIKWFYSYSKLCQFNTIKLSANEIENVKTNPKSEQDHCSKQK